MVVWQTVVLTKMMKSMGRLLEDERRRLQNLMIIFSISYIGNCCYYLY